MRISHGRLDDHRRHAGGRAAGHVGARAAVGGRGDDRAEVERRWTPSWPIDLMTTLSVLGHGRGDPTIRIVGRRGLARDPDAGGTGHGALRASGREVDRPRAGVQAPSTSSTPPAGAGPGRRPHGLRGRRPSGDGRRIPAVRCRAGGSCAPARVLEALVPAVLEQRVTGLEASWAWARPRREVRRAGARPRVGAGRATARRRRAPALFVPPDGPGWDRHPELGLAPGGGGSGHGLARSPRRPAGRRPGDGCRAIARGGRPRRCATEPAGGRCLDRRRGRRPGLGRSSTRSPSATSTSPGAIVHALTGRARRRRRRRWPSCSTPWAGQRARGGPAAAAAGRATPPVVVHAAPITDHRGW